MNLNAVGLQKTHASSALGIIMVIIGIMIGAYATVKLIMTLIDPGTF